MKKLRLLALAGFLTASFSFTSCLTTIALNSVSTSLSGSDKKGKTVKPKKNATSPMIAMTGETDITLVSDFFPTVLKMYEIMQTMNPNHLGLATMTGSLNVMYANAFVQTPADALGVAEVEKQFEEYDRAKLHYIRGRDLCLKNLDGRHKGFKDLLFSGDEEKIKAAVAMMDKDDVDSGYWFAAGHLGAFSLDLMNPDFTGNLGCVVAVAERALSFNPSFNNGSIYELLGMFYCVAPPDFGGDYEKGVEYIQKAIESSKGELPGPYVTFAESVCIPSGDEAGFDEYIAKALAIDPDKNPENRLMTTISQKKANKLKSEKGNYFLAW